MRIQSKRAALYMIKIHESYDTSGQNCKFIKSNVGHLFMSNKMDNALCLMMHLLEIDAPELLQMTHFNKLQHIHTHKCLKIQIFFCLLTLPFEV